jgi:hypothetical protein
MKVVKARYYEASNEIIPLDPQPIRVNGKWDYQRSGTDEKGDFVVIDFITEESVYFDYDAGGLQEAKELKVTTEEEWAQPATLDTASMDLLPLESVPTVDASTLEKSLITSTEMSQATSQTVIEKLIQIIVQPFLSAYAAIISIFRE